MMVLCGCSSTSMLSLHSNVCYTRERRLGNDQGARSSQTRGAARKATSAVRALVDAPSPWRATAAAGSESGSPPRSALADAGIASASQSESETGTGRAATSQTPDASRMPVDPAHMEATAHSQASAATRPPALHAEPPAAAGSHVLSAAAAPSPSVAEAVAVRAACLLDICLDHSVRGSCWVTDLMTVRVSTRSKPNSDIRCVEMSYSEVWQFSCLQAVEEAKLLDGRPPERSWLPRLGSGAGRVDLYRVNKL